MKSSLINLSNEKNYSEKPNYNEENNYNSTTMNNYYTNKELANTYHNKSLMSNMPNIQPIYQGNYYSALNNNAIDANNLINNEENGNIDDDLYYNYNNQPNKGILKNSLNNSNFHDRSRSKSTGFDNYNYSSYVPNFNINKQNTIGSNPIYSVDSNQNNESYYQQKSNHSNNSYIHNNRHFQNDNRSELSTFRRRPTYNKSNSINSNKNYNNYYSDCSSIYYDKSKSPLRDHSRNENKSRLNYNYSNRSNFSTSKSKVNVNDKIFELQKEIEKLKYDNDYLKGQLGKYSYNDNQLKSNSSNKYKNIKFDDNNDDEHTFNNNITKDPYTPSLNIYKVRKNTNIVDFEDNNQSYEARCVSLVEKLKSILNTETITDTYSSIINKINIKRLNKIDELYSKLTELYTNIHGKNSLKNISKIFNSSNQPIGTLVKEENTYKFSDNKRKIIEKTYNSKINDNKSISKSSLKEDSSKEIVEEIKAIWRWVKRLVQRNYFNENKKPSNLKTSYVSSSNQVNTGDRKYNEVVDLIKSIQSEYQLKNVPDLRRFIFSLINKTEKQRSRVNKIKQILDTTPVKSKSVSRSKSNNKYY